jgi:type II secretory pathway pseudopilin PulG
MSRPRPGHGDAGESLVELLVTILILGTSAVAVMGAAAMAVGASTLDHRQTRAQAVLRTWGEAVAGVGDAAYGDCLAAGGVASASPAPSPLPAGFTASVSGVAYWDAATSTYVAGCPAGGDPGLRRVTLRLVADSTLYPGFTETLDVVVRKPCTSC